MAKPTQESGIGINISPTFLVGAISLLVLVLFFGGFFALGQYYATCSIIQGDGQPAGMSSEAFLAEITDFYECIISVLFGVIGVVLAVAFVYVHAISKQQARDMAFEAFESTSFQNELRHRLDEIQKEMERDVLQEWRDFKDSNEWLEQFVNSDEWDSLVKSQRKLRKRVKFVEQVMDAYTAADGETNLELSVDGNDAGGPS